MTEPRRTQDRLGILRRIRVGQLTVDRGRPRTVFGAGRAAGDRPIHLPTAWPRCCAAAAAWATSYMDGLWDTPDLTAVIRVAARNVDRIDERPPPALARPRAVPARPRRVHAQHAAAQPQGHRRPLRPRQRAVRADARPDAHVLVRRSSTHRDTTLEEASLAKLEMVCDKLELGPRDHVLEIGTGWGGFAVYAATTRGCRVTTTTISQEQHDVAGAARRRRPASSTSSTCRLDDYRDLRGTYDKLVSIEMIEAVGWQDFGTFFERCSDLLAPDGDDAAAGDHDGRPRLRGREGVEELHPHLRLPRRLPALARR